MVFQGGFSRSNRRDPYLSKTFKKKDRKLASVYHAWKAQNKALKEGYNSLALIRRAGVLGKLFKLSQGLKVVDAVRAVRKKLNMKLNHKGVFGNQLSMDVLEAAERNESEKISIIIVLGLLLSFLLTIVVIYKRKLAHS